MIDLNRLRRSKSPDFGLSGRSRRLGVGEYVGLGLIAVVVIGSVLYHRFTEPDSSQVVLLIHRDGGHVECDEELVSRLAGGFEPSDEMAVTAYCVNGWYWVTDVTLNTQVVVAGDIELVRAAELVASGRFDPALVEAVERLSP